MLIIRISTQAAEAGFWRGLLAMAEVEERGVAVGPGARPAPNCTAAVLHLKALVETFGPRLKHAHLPPLKYVVLTPPPPTPPSFALPLQRPCPSTYSNPLTSSRFPPSSSLRIVCGNVRPGPPPLPALCAAAPDHGPWLAPRVAGGVANEVREGVDR